MASVVDIVNLALGHIGQSANVSSIDPPDGSAEADFGARFYPIARDALLEMHSWGFATRRADLALLTDAAPDEWAFCYTRPNDAIKVWDVLEPKTAIVNAGILRDRYDQLPEFSVLNLTDNQGQLFVEETLDNGTRVIYTNVENARVIYNIRITDTTKFTPLFVNALSWLLASYLAGPITKDADIKVTTYRMFQQEAAKAMTSDANGRRLNPYTNFTPDGIRARR